jgi:SAM-dependent methyltransferase
VRARPRRPVRAAVGPVLAAGAAGYAVLLRRRLAAFPVLEPTDEPAAVGHRLITAAGVTVDDATWRAASRHARRHGLEVLDLVPADLPVEPLLALAWRVVPPTFRDDPLATGFGADHALLVTDDVLARSRITATADLHPHEMHRVSKSLKRFAPRAMAHAVAPGLSARTRRDPVHGRAWVDSAYAMGAPFILTARAASVAVLAVRALRRRPWGRAGALAFSAQPLVATAGTAFRPADLATTPVVRMATATVERLLSLRRAPGEHAGSAEIAARRVRYRQQLDAGIDGLFEPRRPGCPACGETDLSVRVRTGDLLQGKPGEFTLDECGSCGHVFQNPRLTVEGLAFYYGDFYDGVGEEEMELLGATGATQYAARADFVGAHTEPRRWLDVGGGHGHFSLVARGVWPKARFDVVDLAESVEVAERRGWVDRAHRGLFPELAPHVAGEYDVLSMHHYLEHTRDPGAELDAAAVALEPGGLLSIEMPDPESTLARAMGRWWGPYLQPQHLNMVTRPNLERMLAERGFTVVDAHGPEAHQGADLGFAAYMIANRLGPPVDVPWRPAPTRWSHLRRSVGFSAGMPLIGLGLLVDNAMTPLVPALRASNAYRVLARLDRPARGARER